MGNVVLDEIQLRLLSMISLKESDSEKSSYWRQSTENFSFKDGRVSGINCFSERSKKSVIHDRIHEILQRINFRKISFPGKSVWYKLAREVVNLQARSLDVDMLRQVYTFELLDKNLDLSCLPCICLIGDGQANFASLALKSKSFKKIISVNLPEVLLSDWELIKDLGFEDDAVVISKDVELRAFFEGDRRFGMIQAADCDLLLHQPVDIFINIVSFGEMTRSSISRYFEIIKSSTKGSTLYCCNRREKLLPGGELTRFYDYPWHGYSQILVDEICPWHQRQYTFGRKGFLPYLKWDLPYDGPIDHRLVVYPSLPRRKISCD